MRAAKPLSPSGADWLPREGPHRPARPVALVDAMKFRERFRPELCTIDRGNLRPHLEHVWLDVEKKRLAATNGHLMVFIPCEVEPDDVSGFVPCEAIEYARAHGKDGERAYDWVEMRCGERVECQGASFNRSIDGKFPPVDSAAARQQPGDPGTVTLAIDSRYLRRLAAALGGEDEERGGPAHVRLVIKVPADPAAPMIEPIAVVCNDDAGGDYGTSTATLMPCKATVSSRGTGPLLPVACAACGHEHSGPEMGRICIGCPCQEGQAAS